MKPTEQWRTLKVRQSQYDALSLCSEVTGRSILQLADEALKWFNQTFVPIYMDNARKAQVQIQAKLSAGMKRRKPA